MSETISRGYLHEPYRLFHSSDQRDADFEVHCHDFHKVVFCLQGSVAYIMEGNRYDLQSGDILLIPQGQIHRSILRGDTVYERIILWIKDSFLCSFEEEALLRPFASGSAAKTLYRPQTALYKSLLAKLTAAENCRQQDFAGCQLMQNTYVVQFLLELSRYLSRPAVLPENAVHTDPKVQQILAYINAHLTEKMPVEQLARQFYISPSHLMHLFKRHTGLSVHQYILKKRLANAWEAIRSGERVLHAAAQAGFQDYSAFLKAFRSQYGVSPREMH